MMIKDIANKKYLIAAVIVIGLLLVSGWVLKLKINLLKKNNARNLEVLEQALPGFNTQSIVQLKKQEKNLKEEVLKLAGVFDPKERWLKKDYDLSIYFVEELGKINQFLKTKAIDKEVSAQELGFKEKLPSDQEAFYLLSQLYGLKEVISLGTEQSIDFKSINAQGIEDAEGISGVKLAKSKIELNCPVQGLIEFIIRLNQTVPRPNIDALALKAQDSSFELSLNLSHIVMGLDWKAPQEVYAPIDIKELSARDEDFMRILRGNNPFLLSVAKEAPFGKELETAGAAEARKLKKLSRFLYRGKAVLKSKEVVVIEDTLNKETVFIGEGGKIDNFLLKKFSNEEMVLKNINDGQEIIVKREVK